MYLGANFQRKRQGIDMSYDKEKKKKLKKTGYSCYVKKCRGFENPIDKVKRWKRNVKYAYQRIKYGYCDSDVWSIDYWFLGVMPGMLQQLKETKHGYPSCFLPESDVYEISQESEDAAVKKWNEVLSEMIFLLGEANEDTCTRKNKYEAEYRKASKEFDKKYGLFGEKLKTPEEKAEEKKQGSHRVYMLGDVPEYKEISDLYYKESMALMEYRDECKDKALEMFREWFWNLWD
jgi:hypothetical protein